MGVVEASITWFEGAPIKCDFCMIWRRSTQTFDDLDLVSRAGLIPVMGLAQRAGLQDLVAEHARIGRRCGLNAPVKISCLAVGMITGADSIDDMDLLRHGAMPALFGGMRAPSSWALPARLHLGQCAAAGEGEPAAAGRAGPGGSRCCPARTRSRSWTSTRCRNASTGTPSRARRSGIPRSGEKACWCAG
jgi:hypothetical protein